MSEQVSSTYYYQAFGLIIASAFEIPEFYNSEPLATDVRIIFGEVPQTLSHTEKKGVRFELNSSEFLLHVDGIADYYVKEGKSIIINIQKDATNQEMRLFLLSTVFSALIYQRGHVAMHASAIKRGDSCMLICGNSGAGKSTLTRSFIDKGYKVLSDDITVLAEQEKFVFAQPAFPFIKLWKDSLEHLNMDETEGFRLREELEKYGFQLYREFYPEPLKIDQVFILTPHNKPEYEHEILKGVQKFNALKNQTYRYQFVLNDLRPVHFNILNKLANQADLILLKRPQTPIDTQKLQDKIEKLLKGEK